MALKITQPRNSRNAAVSVKVTCDDCGVEATAPANPKMNTRDQLRDVNHPNMWLTRNGWHVTPNGNNHRCPACVDRFAVVAKETEQQEADMAVTEQKTRAINYNSSGRIDGVTKSGVDMYHRAEPLAFRLAVETFGQREVSETLGIDPNTVAVIVQYGVTNTHGNPVKSASKEYLRKIYEVAAEGMLLREEIKAKNDMIDRAQDRANKAEQQVAEFSNAAANLRVQNAALFDKNEALARQIEELTERNLVLGANRVDNVIVEPAIAPPVSLKEAIKSYFNRNAFQLTIDDLAMLDKTLRQVGTEE